MRQASCKGWAIVEREFGTALRELQAGLKGINVSPELDNFLFLISKIEGGGD